MKTQPENPLHSVACDRSEYERAVIRVACTGTNEDLREVLDRMKHRASLSLVSAGSRCDDPSATED